MGRPLTNSRNSNPKFFEKRKTYQAVSARFTQIAGHQNFSIVLIHYLCEPNYIIGELRVQTELASQVLFFLSEKRGRRDERGQDERGGIKKRQKRRKGTRKEKSSKNDRGTQTTLSGRLMWIISCKKRQRQWIKKRSSKGEKAFRQGRNVSKENKTSMCCGVSDVKRSEDDVSVVGALYDSETCNWRRRESFHNLTDPHTDLLMNNRLRLGLL